MRWDCGRVETRLLERGDISPPSVLSSALESELRASESVVGGSATVWEGDVQDLEAFSEYCSTSLSLGRSWEGFRQRSKVLWVSPRTMSLPLLEVSPGVHP